MGRIHEVSSTTLITVCMTWRMSWMLTVVCSRNSWHSLTSFLRLLIVIFHLIISLFVKDFFLLIYQSNLIGKGLHQWFWVQVMSVVDRRMLHAHFMHVDWVLLVFVTTEVMDWVYRVWEKFLVISAGNALAIITSVSMFLIGKTDKISLISLFWSVAVVTY